MVASPNLCSRAWITEQYDRYVLGNTVLAMPNDGGVLRLDDNTYRGIALSTDGNGRFARLDPYAGAQLALAEAYRNVAVTGARPVAVTDCLNFGSPEDPEVMWQFAETTRGLADACQVLGVPVTGGNVSFYNQTGATAINPTPVIGVLGVIDDVRQRTASGFPAPGLDVLLLGTTRDEFGGSEWAHEVHGHLGGLPPSVDLEAERNLAQLLVRASQEGVLASAHDLSDGGLTQALAESCLHGNVGARIALAGDPFVALFSESATRVIVAVDPTDTDRLVGGCGEHGIPVTRLGTTGGDTLAVDGLFEISLSELRTAYEETLPRLFG
jgi:phosphoribosylformylglycinamidine synthase